MRKTRKTAAVVALYTFLMLGSVSVVRADQPVTREQISSEQTETKTDSSAQTTESEATTETTTQTTQAKPTTEATTHTHTTATTHTTAAATHTKKHTAATHTKSDQDKKKDKKDKKQKIYFADFESDVSGEIHRPFLCIIQNIDGTETKIFKEGSCGKDMLDYLPNKSITYFHNLAYDIRMFAHYGIFKSIIKSTKCLSASI